jgi:hypothetical protein
MIFNYDLGSTRSNFKYLILCQINIFPLRTFFFFFLYKEPVLSLFILTLKISQKHLLSFDLHENH